MSEGVAESFLVDPPNIAGCLKTKKKNIFLSPKGLKKGGWGGNEHSNKEDSRLVIDTLWA